MVKWNWLRKPSIYAVSILLSSSQTDLSLFQGSFVIDTNKSWSVLGCMVFRGFPLTTAPRRGYWGLTEGVTSAWLHTIGTVRCLWGSRHLGKLPPMSASKWLRNVLNILSLAALRAESPTLFVVNVCYIVHIVTGRVS